MKCYELIMNDHILVSDKNSNTYEMCTTLIVCPFSYFMDNQLTYKAI